MIVKDKSENNAYIRIEPCRSKEEIEKINLNVNNLAGRKSSDLIDMYFENEGTNKKRKFVELEFKKTYKARYGMVFNVLLPEDVSRNPLRLHKLTTRLMDFIVDKEKGLKYCWKVKKIKTGFNKFMYMLVIWCLDREYYPHTEVVKYKRDGWINKYTKSFTKKDDPEAILSYQKGQVKEEKKMLFKVRKTRLFAFGSNEAFTNYTKILKDYYLMLLEEVMGLKVHKGILFRRHNLRKAYNCYIRRIMMANNRARKYIQNKLNHLLARLRSGFGVIPYENFKLKEINIPLEEYELPSFIKTTFESLVEKYRTIFKHDYFYQEDTKFTIYDGHADEVEQNLEYLVQLAQEEINTFEYHIRLKYLFGSALEMD